MGEVARCALRATGRALTSSARLARRSFFFERRLAGRRQLSFLLGVTELRFVLDLNFNAMSSSNFLSKLCCFSGRELANRRLSGPLPAELGKLEQLQYMCVVFLNT